MPRLVAGGGVFTWGNNYQINNGIMNAFVGAIPLQ